MKALFTSLFILLISIPSWANNLSEDKVNAISRSLSNHGFAGATNFEVVEQPRSFRNALRGFGHAIIMQSADFVFVTFDHQNNRYRCSGDLARG